MKANRKQKTLTPPTTDIFIREVRATYHMTETPPFAIKDPVHVAAFVRSVLTDNSREHFIAMYLDSAHRVAGYSTISIGTATMTTVHPREVFQRAILIGAVAIVVAHNHPSGILTPSVEDLSVTERLKDAGKLLGIALLDHLILSEVDHVSILEQ